MTASIIKNPEGWVGTSAEMSSLVTTTTPVGSRFFNVTDGYYYVLSNDGTTWVQDVSPVE